MAASVRPDWERRSVTGGVLLVAGGAVITLGTFLPWLRGRGGTVTGWELYDLREQAGENPFLIDKMFRSTFDPFFTGAVTIFFGVLLAFLGALALALPKRPPPSRYRTSPAIYFPAMFALIFVFLAVVGNIAAVVRAPAGTDTDWGVGLFVVAVGVVLGLVGTPMAGAATRAQLAARPVAMRQPTGTPLISVPPATPAPAMGAQPAPGWYADPEGRHEHRYWDGRTWSSHVSDGGAPGEDPILTSR